MGMVPLYLYPQDPPTWISFVTPSAVVRSTVPDPKWGYVWWKKQPGAGNPYPETPTPMFSLRADTTSVTCPSRPWIARWRAAAGFDYGDFAMEFHCVRKEEVPSWEAFKAMLRAMSHVHTRRVMPYPETYALAAGYRAQEIGSTPSGVLWECCAFGTIKMPDADGTTITLAPAATLADVARVETEFGVPSLASLAASLTQAMNGDVECDDDHCDPPATIADACIPGAFDPIADWLYFHRDGASDFQAGFETSTRWYWVWSSSS